jgi:hypothetical protein
MEYQRAAGMPALQHFIFELEKKMKLAMIFCQMQNVLIFVEKRNVLYRMFWFNHTMQYP